MGELIDKDEVLELLKYWKHLEAYDKIAEMKGVEMTYWCESCARKNICYTIRNRPKCFTPITNTAHGTPESYIAKSLRYSQDSHELQTERSE